jgi:hypothetical protein
MNTLVEKIKNLFKGMKKPKFKSPKKPQSESKLLIGADEISESIRESDRAKLCKNSWRNVFHL